jgi:Xaa-Pro dipeptidase
MKLLFELGSEHVEAINAISGDRCNPHPHTFSDRLLRPGDQAFFDIIHSFTGYRHVLLPHVQRRLRDTAQIDAYTRCREGLDDAIERVRPGVTTDQIAEVWPTARGDRHEGRAAPRSGCQFGHGLGVGLTRRR